MPSENDDLDSQGNSHQIPSKNQNFKQKFALSSLLIVAITAIGVFVTTQNVKREQLKNSFAQVPNTSDEIEGVLREKVVDNLDNKKAEHFYYLETKKADKIELIELKKEAVQNIPPGSKIKIKNSQRATTAEGISMFATTSSENVALVETASVANNQFSTGNPKVAVILVGFRNLPMPPRDKTAYVNEMNNQVKPFFAATSYNLFNPATLTTADVFGPYTLNKDYSCFNFKHADWDGLVMADPQVDYRTYKHILVVAPHKGDGECNGISGYAYIGGTSRVTADGLHKLSVANIASFDFTKRVIVHEMGHTFGANHSSSLACTNMDISPSGCVEDEYNDPYDPMGAHLTTYGFNVYRKQLFGWLNPSNTQTAHSNGIYRIHPVVNRYNEPELKSQGLKVCRSTANYFFVENRVSSGIDAGIGANATNGALIRLADYYKNWPAFLYGSDNFIVNKIIDIDNPPRAWTELFRDYPRLEIIPKAKTNNILEAEVKYNGFAPNCSAVTEEKAFFAETISGDYNITCGLRKDTRNEIYFGTDPTCNQPHEAYFVFKGVVMPAAKTLTAAYLEFTEDGPYTNALTQRITFSDGATTSSSYPWNIAATEAWKDYYVRRVDVTNAAKQVLKSLPFPQTQTITTKITHVSGAGERRVFASEREPEYNYKARLILKYGLPPVPVSTETPSPPPVVVPGAPTLVSPANASLSTSTSLTFTWQAPANGGVANYNFILDDNSDFLSPIVNDATIASNIFSLTRTLTRAKTYYWKVRAKNSQGTWGPWSTTRNVKISYTAPTLSAPTNGATGVAIRPLLNWNDVTGVSGYNLQILRTTNFTTSTPNINATASQHQPSVNLVPKTKYYWRVQAIGTYGPSAWSSVRSFTTTQ